MIPSFLYNVDPVFNHLTVLGGNLLKTSIHWKLIDPYTTAHATAVWAVSLLSFSHGILLAGIKKWFNSIHQLNYRMDGISAEMTEMVSSVYVA